MVEQQANTVECYAGFRYAQRPTAVIWEGQRYPVTAVQAEWRTPEACVYKVVAGERAFEAVYLEAEDRWAVAAR